MSDKINVLISEEDVEKRIQEIGSAISKEYEGKCVHLICVLKGGVFFACELAKRISVPVTMDFMSVSSYGDDTKSSGVVKIVKDLDRDSEKEKSGKPEAVYTAGQTGTSCERSTCRLHLF